jgi:hypothetical protein
VDLLIENRIIKPEDTVISHATPEDIAGCDVIGVLPLSLAAMANSVTEIPLTLEPSDRGVELTLERMRQISGPPVTYRVQLEL